MTFKTILLTIIALSTIRFNPKPLGYGGVMQPNYGQLGSQGNLMLDVGIQSQ